MKKGSFRFCFLLLILLSNTAHAQQLRDTPVIQVRNNFISITIAKSVSVNDLASFTHRYNLKDIGLYQLIFKGDSDSLKESGWETQSAGNRYNVTKKLSSGGKLINPSDKMIFYAIPTPDTWRVQGGNRVIYGVNDFKNDNEPLRTGNVVTFRLKGFPRARRVRLAGNFTNWQHGAFPMTRDGDDWIVNVRLEPGAWYYKYILNDGEWTTDPGNNLEENDGHGNINSVFYVPNKTIQLDGYTNADEVFISGTFNNWVKDQLAMKKKNNGWELEIYLEPGTHRYQYIVNGTALSSDQKQIAEIGATYLFKLNGFKDAKRVALAGNFNDWIPDQLFMKKTATGWELPYALGPGNYMYKFIVDGKWMPDPTSENIIQDGKGNENSFLVYKPNYQFKLRGHGNAKRIYVAGDFNEWNPKLLPMKRINGVWIADVFLGRGKHKYKFIVDGNWLTDPVNPLVEDNDNNSGNSVLWIE